jgi:hypothetical protein
MSSKACAGLNQLLRNYPEAELAMAWNQNEEISDAVLSDAPSRYDPREKLLRPPGPWLIVDLFMDGKIVPFAIWNLTGNVYHLQGPEGEYPGAVEDDAFIIVTPMGVGDGE